MLLTTSFYQEPPRYEPLDTLPGPQIHLLAVPAKDDFVSIDGKVYKVLQVTHIAGFNVPQPICAHLLLVVPEQGVAWS